MDEGLFLSSALLSGLGAAAAATLRGEREDEDKKNSPEFNQTKTKQRE